MAVLPLPHPWWLHIEGGIGTVSASSGDSTPTTRARGLSPLVLLLQIYAAACGSTRRGRRRAGRSSRSSRLGRLMCCSWKPPSENNVLWHPARRSKWGIKDDVVTGIHNRRWYFMNFFATPKSHGRPTSSSSMVASH